MPKAEHDSTTHPAPRPSRRGLLAGSTVALLAGAVFVTPARAAPVASAVATGDDAELIRLCHQFAESEIDDWYRYVVADDDEAEEIEKDQTVDWGTYHRIIATPAVTPEGWHAKALAFTAWDRDSYDDHKDERDPSTTFLASLLRDMVAPARNAIIARCAAKYGPLPPSYTPEGIWLGYTPEEKAASAARVAEMKAAMDPERIAEFVRSEAGASA
jgi:hypothetical protein